MKKILLAALLFLVTGLNKAISQTKDITGTITNEKNENVVGAAIKIKGTTLSAFSDDNGVFNLTGVPDTAVLVISAAGYQEMEVKVADRTSFSIVLVKSSGSIDAIPLALLNNRQLYLKAMFRPT
jgi:TonB-dependent starch-binding outer membrane protein SusC